MRKIIGHCFLVTLLGIPSHMTVAKPNEVIFGNNMSMDSIVLGAHPVQLLQQFSSDWFSGLVVFAPPVPLDGKTIADTASNQSSGQKACAAKEFGSVFEYAMNLRGCIAQLERDEPVFQRLLLFMLLGIFVGYLQAGMTTSPRKPNNQR